MSVSIIDVLKEQARQQATGDVDFYKIKPYIFKLIAPSNKGPVGPMGYAYFPLPIAPQEYHYSLPFASQITPTQDGGLTVEEGGIVIGQIRLSGTMGLKKKKARDTSASSGNPRFTGLIPKRYAGSMWEMSGQMLLWRLLGRCFDAYSELKKDPTTSAKTSLEFHCLKDSIHVVVVPSVAEVTGNTSPYRIARQYTFDLQVIGPASPPNAADLKLLSDDKDIFDFISDAISHVRSSLSLLKGTIDDLTACLGDMKRYISNVVGIVDDMKSVLNAASDFVAGVTSFVNIPKQTINSLLNLVEAAYGVANTAEDLPRKAVQAWSEAADALDAINAGCKNHFREDADAQVTRINGKINRLFGLSDQQQANLEAAASAGSAGGGTMSVAQVYSGEFTPGDAAKQAISQAIPDLQPGEFTGFKEVQVGQGDTIQSIAIKYMGDAHKWKAIAILNNLKPPYISSGTKMPGTLTIGDPIVVPINTATGGISAATTGNPIQGSSQIADRMGTDLRWDRLDSGQYSWAIDFGHGAGDLITVKDIDNLSQALGVIMRTEQGTNQAFPGVGMPRLVGGTVHDQLFAEARFAMESQITADRRIERLLGLKLELVQDVLTIVTDVQPVGYDGARQIPVTLYG